MLFSITGYLSVKFDGRAVIYDDHGDCMARWSGGRGFFKLFDWHFKIISDWKMVGEIIWGAVLVDETQLAVERKLTLF